MTLSAWNVVFTFMFKINVLCLDMCMCVCANNSQQWNDLELNRTFCMGCMGSKSMESESLLMSFGYNKQIKGNSFILVEWATTTTLKCLILR